MHQFFMLVVILALLPAAIATALALGQILFYLLILAIIVFVMIYLVLNPSLLLELMSIAFFIFIFFIVSYGVMWIAAHVEGKWPRALQRLCFGAGALMSISLAIGLIIDGLKRGMPMSETLLILGIFGVITAIFVWLSIKAKPIDTSKWFKV
jgi:hypothetical protein